MQTFPEGHAIVYCEGAFGTTNGKTAHGLVRRTLRYRVLSVVDSHQAGRDAGNILDGKPNGVLVYPDIETAFQAAKASGVTPTHLVVGLAPDGGRLNAKARQDVMRGITLGLNVDSGLHDLLSEDPEIATLAQNHHIKIRDVRKCPPRQELHFFTGKIEEVKSLKVAVLGTDSAVGKRTTAWILVDALRKAGYTAEMIGTGQTAWMQGARYCTIEDSVISDFMTGEIEHAIWSAWNDLHPDVIVIEGQGSLLNPAYPGGYEIIGAGRPDFIVLQHAPARLEYDGFPGYPIQPIERQIQALELISNKPVIAITINHENLTIKDIDDQAIELKQRTGVPAFDVLKDGADQLAQLFLPYLKAK